MSSLTLATRFCCNLAWGRSPGRCRSCTFYMFYSVVCYLYELVLATIRHFECSGSWTEMDFHTNKLTRNFLQFFAWLACLQTEILWCFVPSKTKGFVLFDLPTCQCRGKKTSASSRNKTVSLLGKEHKLNWSYRWLWQTHAIWHHLLKQIIYL
mgnify:CR=1 FL=1